MDSPTATIRRFLVSLFISLLLTGLAARTDGAKFPATVIDDLGRKIVLPHPVERIVSLAPSVTEILFAVGAGPKVVGDTIYCDYPPAARSLPHIGNMLDPNIEEIVALKPDMVIVSSETLQPAEANQLSMQYRAPVFVTAARTYAGVMQDVRELGVIAGNPRATAAAIRGMQSALNKVQKAAIGRPKPRVFVVIWEKPLMTASGRSYIGDLIRIAGGTNVAEKEPGLPYPGYPEEKLVREDPDILLASGKGDQVQQAALPTLSRLNLRAIRSGYMYLVPDDWTSRPGPRLGLGLEAIAHILHREAFSSR